MPDEYEISTDPARQDIEVVHTFLRDSYWARGVPRAVVERSMRHSLCVGAFRGRCQVGFARAVTDRASFAYLADVFVLPEHRRRGLSKRMVQALLEHPELAGLRRWLLATKDAHGLYASLGFQPLPNPEAFMTIHHPDIYRAPSS